MRDLDQLEPNGWLDSARSGDPSAMEHLRAYLEGPVLESLGHCRGCGIEPEDILAETVISVLEALWEGKNIENLLAYARGIALKLRADARREASRLKSLSTESAEVSDCILEVPDEGLRNLEREELLERALRRLEDSQRWLFDLLFIQGSTNEEARQQLAVSKLAFRGRKHRLFCRLREAIQEFVGTICLIFALLCESRFCA